MKLNNKDLQQVVGGLINAKFASALCLPNADGSGSVESAGQQESGPDVFNFNGGPFSWY